MCTKICTGPVKIREKRQNDEIDDVLEVHTKGITGMNRYLGVLQKRKFQNCSKVLTFENAFQKGI